MSNTHYVHMQKTGATCSVQILDRDREELLQVAKYGLNCHPLLKVGLAVLHPKDKQYNKKLGREIADSKAKDCLMELRHFLSSKDRNVAVYFIQKFPLHETVQQWRQDLYKQNRKNNCYQVPVVLVDTTKNRVWVMEAQDAGKYMHKHNEYTKPLNRIKRLLDRYLILLR